MTPTERIRAGEPAPCRPWPRTVLAPEAWAAMAAGLADDPALALLALWADTACVHALFQDRSDGAVLATSAALVGGAYRALSPARPVAAWFERMIADLWGHEAAGGIDRRPWLDHGRWEQRPPLSPRARPTGGSPEPPEFLAPESLGIEGEDHQRPIGPVTGMLGEAFHLRLTVRGAAVLRAEARLGYAHKGAFGLMRGKPPRIAARFAARLAASATVAHAVAFARAAEAALGTEAPPRAHALRAVMAEIERIAAHLDDLAEIAAASGADGAAHRLETQREAVRCAAAAAFGHRLMMDVVVPGGISADLAPGGAEAIMRLLDALEPVLPSLRAPFAAGSALGLRMAGLGPVPPGLADRLAAGGPAGRAAGRDADARRAPGYPPYGALAVPVRGQGDAAARAAIRLDEIAESLRLLRGLVSGLPDGATSAPQPLASGEGIGVAEGPLGDVWHWLRLDNGVVAAAFARDPGWAQWPLVEAALTGAAPTDAALILRSFAPSVSGVDL